MKKLFLGLALAAGLIATTAHAQDARGGGANITPEQRAERQTAMMTKRLGLSPDQVEKVKAINLKHAQDAQAVRDARKDEKGAQPGAMKDMKAEKDAELKAVLTPEQFTTWTQMEANMQERRQQRRSGDAAPAPAPTN